MISPALKDLDRVSASPVGPARSGGDASSAASGMTRYVNQAACPGYPLDPR